jgi:hypothetical protein
MTADVQTAILNALREFGAPPPPGNDRNKEK